MTETVKRAETEKMKRVRWVYEDEYFQECLMKTEFLEKDRIFCHHDMDHLITTARLAYIFSLERGYGLPKDIIYTAALLHDIGRFKEYEEGICHDEAGAVIAGEILVKYDVTDEEINMICDAVGSHRKNEQYTSRLSEVIFDADKASRECFRCPGEDKCNWSDGKKNSQMIW